MAQALKPPAEEMTYEDMQLMVAEGVNDIDADKLVKVMRVMFDATVRWNNAKDRYLVRLP